MIESEKLSYLTTVCNLYPFAGINTVIRRIPHHGEMTTPVFSQCSLTTDRTIPSRPDGNAYGDAPWAQWWGNSWVFWDL